mmetsp:Transcript_3930/g.8255  ORF Transcript_3930/g.8255 Transcript_3930/m.8255 type:complete len:235 (+) Transcript_3930:91-795(+)
MPVPIHAACAILVTGGGVNLLKDVFLHSVPGVLEHALDVILAPRLDELCVFHTQTRELRGVEKVSRVDVVSVVLVVGHASPGVLGDVASHAGAPEPPDLRGAVPEPWRHGLAEILIRRLLGHAVLALDAVPRVPLVGAPPDGRLAEDVVLCHGEPVAEVPRPAQEVAHALEVIVFEACDGRLGLIADAVQDVRDGLAEASERYVLPLVPPHCGPGVHLPVVVPPLLLPRTVAPV